MITEYTYKFRIYPSEEQKKFLNIQFGHCRFVYNKLLEMAIKEYKEQGMKWNYYTYKKKLPQLKEEYPFLKQANSQSLQEVVKNLDRAFKSFFKGLSGFPQLKKKKSKQSVTIPQHFSIERVDNKTCLLKIPKLNTPIKVRKHRDIEGEIRSISITKTSDEKYYVNILTKRQIYQSQPSCQTNKIIGIDVGIKEFAVMFDGKQFYHIENPKYLQKSEKRLKTLQRQLSRKQKGSKNREKQKAKLAKLHQKIVNQRREFLHKVSIAITKQYDTIVVETLNIRGLIQNRALSKQIADVSWHEFVRMLEYKSRWYNKQVIKASTFYPSSKTCSICGYKNEWLTLSVREWQCPMCGTHHNRDENASANLYKIGCREGTARIQACGECSDSGMVEIPVYESSFNETGSPSIY